MQPVWNLGTLALDQPDGTGLKAEAPKLEGTTLSMGKKRAPSMRTARQSKMDLAVNILNVPQRCKNIRAEPFRGLKSSLIP